MENYGNEDIMIQAVDVSKIYYYHTGVDTHPFTHEHYWEWSKEKLKHI